MRRGEPDRDPRLPLEAIQVPPEATLKQPGRADDLDCRRAPQQSVLRRPQGSRAPPRQRLDQAIRAELAKAGYGSCQPESELPAEHGQCDGNQRVVTALNQSPPGSTTDPES